MDDGNEEDGVSGEMTGYQRSIPVERAPMKEATKRAMRTRGTSAPKRFSKRCYERCAECHAIAVSDETSDESINKMSDELVMDRTMLRTADRH